MGMVTKCGGCGINPRLCNYDFVSLRYLCEICEPKIKSGKPLKKEKKPEKRFVVNRNYRREYK